MNLDLKPHLEIIFFFKYHCSSPSSSFSPCWKAGRRQRLITSHLSSGPSMRAWGTTSDGFACTFGLHLYNSGWNHKTRLKSRLFRDTAVVVQSILSGSLALRFSSMAFQMDADGTVLVLPPLPGARQLSHVTASLPGSTVSFPRYPSITKGVCPLPCLAVPLKGW